jgi:transcriptional regulator with XRE-family HTH domain
LFSVQSLWHNSKRPFQQDRWRILRDASKAVAVELTPDVVGARIRTARLERGWTHEELARRMGANWRTAQRWQQGKLPRLPTLMRLADILGVPHAYFVDREIAPGTLDSLRAQVDELSARVDMLERALREGGLPSIRRQATG